MGDQVKIDKTLFHDRLSLLHTTWKNDNRAKDGIFHGANSIVVVMGKAEEAGAYQKNGALQVCTTAATERCHPRC